MKPKTDLENCNFCKTVLMIVIIFFHSGLSWTGNWFVTEPDITSSSLALFIKWLGSFHVYAFTLISGYIYYYVRYEREGYKDPKLFLLNKAHRLLVPFIAICIFWVIPLTDYFYHFSWPEIVRKYLLGESPNQLWFILMLFGVFAIAYPLSNIFNRQGWKSIWLVGLIFAAGVGFAYTLPRIWQISIAMQYLLYFWVGFIIRRHYKALHTKVLTKWGGVFLGVNIIAFTICLIYRNIFTTIVCGGISHVSGAIMAFFLLIALGRYISWDTTLFKRLSKSTYSIYLIHQQIIYFLLYYINWILNPWMSVFIIFLMTTLVSWGICVILEKFNFTRKIIGLSAKTT